nr:Cirhin [Hymenolepis microstoma]
MQAPSRIPFEGLPLIDYFPKPITSLARNKKGLIAASRIDGSIDIYDANEGFFVIHHLPSWILTSIEAVCWVHDRLFATGGEGRVYELQLYSIRPRAGVLLPGGVPARCLVPGEDILVSGNDGGFINVIDVSDDQLNLKTCLASLDDKIVSLALDDKNRKIVAASDAKGRVYILSLETGSTLSTYFVGDEYAATPTIVWSLLFVGNSLFSGDSKGNVSVWDVDIGVMVSTFKTHTVDVLALAASSDQSMVFATGVDPTIRRFDLCITERNTQWQPSGFIKGGRRDINCLLFVGEGESTGLRAYNADVDYLVAAGNDSRLKLLPCPRTQANLGSIGGLTRKQRKKEQVMSKLPTPIHLPFWPFSLAPNLPLAVHFAVDTFGVTEGPPGRMCLIQHVDHLNLYRFPSKPNKKVKDQPRFVLQLARIQPLRGNYVVTSAISPCGKFLAYSDDVRSRVLIIKKSTSRKNWNFDAASGEPVVTLSRLGWMSSSQERRIRNISSSASSDNEAAAVEETVDEMSTSRFFLDQSSADLFVTSSKGDKSLRSLSGPDKDFDSHLAVVAPQTRKRKVDGGQSEDQSDEASALPPASLMSFTPSSRCLVTVDSISQNVVCRRLDTGVECWNLSRHRSVSTKTDNTPVAPIHILKMVKFVGEHSSLILLAIASLDARVSIYSFKEGENSPPTLLFTCPRAADPIRVGYHPRPVDIALRIKEFKACESESEDASSEVLFKARSAVFYTSGQLVEWILHLSFVEGVGVQLKGTPRTDPWLEEFWQQNSASWRRLMPRFCYLNYYYGGKILILGSKNICLTIDRRKKVALNDVQWAFRKRNSKISDHCLHIFDTLKNAVEHAVLPDRIAAITLNLVAANAELPIPLKKKYFGT